jgi:hypothetical protein
VTAAPGVVSTAAGVAAAGDGLGDGDTTGEGATTSAAVAEGVGFALGFPEPLTAPTTTVPPQHSTRNVAMMPRISASFGFPLPAVGAVG